MEIEHIDQVLPHLVGHPEFIVAERPGYKVIDYNFAMADSFDHPMRLECRGIKFDASGRILARPFQKFFNIGERVDTQPHVLDFTSPHTITQKLDGSMIHPALVDGQLVFMTRMGRTDVAMKAERHLTEDMAFALRAFLQSGFTPIFEFTAPDNRIVIKYPVSGLTLLAARHTFSGKYMTEDNLIATADEIGVPVVKHLSPDWKSGPEFMDFARAIMGEEGFVVRFASGLWVKAKGDDYVLKHKAKDSIFQEKNVLALVVSGEIDDVLPLLEDQDKDLAEKYRDGVMIGIAEAAAKVQSIVSSGAHLTQKEFAVDHLKDVPGLYKPLAFSVRGGADAMVSVKAMIAKNATSQAGVDSIRPLHGQTWEV